jgi:hypothetical protein
MKIARIVAGVTSTGGAGRSLTRRGNGVAARKHQTKVDPAERGEGVLGADDAGEFGRCSASFPRGRRRDPRRWKVPGMNRVALAAALGVGIALAACGVPEETQAPEGPAASAARSKGSDEAGDPERRAKFLAGSSAAGAAGLVETNNPANLDAVATFFVNPQKPYSERLTALVALRTLRAQDPEEYARVFPRVRPKLWEEVSHGAGMSMSRENERGFVEAVGWLSDQKDPEARFKLEFHLDRDTVKRKRLPNPALCAAALGLASYPGSDSARDTLWAALKDPKESGVVRSCCLKALRPFHPADLESLVIQLPCSPEDEWLHDLQRRLR